jgi:hypothetical protein
MAVVSIVALDANAPSFVAPFTLRALEVNSVKGDGSTGFAVKASLSVDAASRVVSSRFEVLQRFDS